MQHRLWWLLQVRCRCRCCGAGSAPPARAAAAAIVAAAGPPLPQSHSLAGSCLRLDRCRWLPRSCLLPQLLKRQAAAAGSPLRRLGRSRWRSWTLLLPMRATPRAARGPTPQTTPWSSPRLSRPAGNQSCAVGTLADHRPAEKLGSHVYAAHTAGDIRHPHAVVSGFMRVAQQACARTAGGAAPCRRAGWGRPLPQTCA